MNPIDATVQTEEPLLPSTTETFLAILALLSQANERAQLGGDRQTEALLRKAIGLVGGLSASILAPVTPAVRSRLHTWSESRSTVPSELLDESDFDTRFDRALSISGSSHTTASSRDSTSPRLDGGLGGAGGGSRAIVAPGTPSRAYVSNPLLTPPPSHEKQLQRFNVNAPAFAVRAGYPSPNANEFIGPDDGALARFAVPAGFQSSVVPSQSDHDFHLRAMYHRAQGRGVQEAYDVTLTLQGATVIDGVLIHFKITDGYFNPETYNYSESLARTDGSGVTGYRYDNRNGSSYIRFDEPTGPRVSFSRHAHPPHTISPTATIGLHALTYPSPTSSSVLSLRSPAHSHQHNPYHAHSHSQPHHSSSNLMNMNLGLGFGFGKALPPPSLSASSPFPVDLVSPTSSRTIGGGAPPQLHSHASSSSLGNPSSTSSGAFSVQQFWN